MSAETTDARQRFIHRDLSWLAFNERVLDAGFENRYPLLERLRFLAIFANNLDEFFMVRVARTRRLIAGSRTGKDAFGYYPGELLEEVSAVIDRQLKRLRDYWKGPLAKELRTARISLLRPDDLNTAQKRFARSFFEAELQPVITPLAIDQGHPFPVLPSRAIVFGVRLTRYDKPYLALVPVPRNIPRVLRLPSEADEIAFILLEEIIRQHLEAFFRGYRVASATAFRVLRDSELSADEDDSRDLLKTIEEETRKRPHAKIVRLEAEQGADPALLDSLCLALDVPPAEVVVTAPPFDMTCLFPLIARADRPRLLFPAFAPGGTQGEGIFDRTKAGDFLVHLPYESFQPTLELVEQAAGDAGVLGIKMTLYRVSDNSPVVRALAAAARAGKQVTVLVEIKARFDEERNIRWVKDLEDAGCHVVYGIPGMKIHSKMCMVVRKEDGRIRRYTHLSTGNYNERTAALYTDVGYFTANDDFARDISDVFNVITGYSVPGRWRRVVSSPNDLRQYFFELVDREIECQKEHGNGMVFAKMNSLEDPGMIEKLYEASSAGVTVRLIVRGICCLVPGVKGMSDRIEVKSVVGRFLEHSRIFLFNNNREERVFLSSADWMRRNLDRRIELLYEIRNDRLKERLRAIMAVYWKDTLSSRWLTADGSYAGPPEKAEPFDAQEHLMQHPDT